LKRNIGGPEINSFDASQEEFIKFSNTSGELIEKYLIREVKDNSSDHGRRS
jgi:hypothetical protein